MNDGKERPKGSNRYLPYLTSLLLIFVALWFIVQYMTRPAHGLQEVAAAARIIKKSYYKDVDEEKLYKAAIKGMVASLDDRFSSYMTPVEYQQAHDETEGEFGGIGVSIRPQKDGAMIVTIQPGGPADKANMKPGDLVVEVNGKSCTGLPIEEVVALVRGPVGKSVSITVKRNGSPEPITFEVERAKIEFPFVQWHMAEPGIGYLRLAQFYKDAADKFAQGIKELSEQGMKVLIIDLRENGGGLLKQCVRICHMFVDSGVIVSVSGRLAKESTVFKATSGVVVPKDMPVFVLVDGQSASATEILAAMLQDYKRATLVGTKTFGKGAVNRMYILQDHSALVLTVAHYTSPNGRIINDKGIVPDVVVGELPAWNEDKDMTAQQWMELFRKAQEEQLNTALKLAREALKEKPATEAEGH